MKNGEKYEHSFSVHETRRINDVRDFICREYALGCHKMLKYTECRVIVNYILACHKTLSYILVCCEILNYFVVYNKILNLVQFLLPIGINFENHCCKWWHFYSTYLPTKGAVNEMTVLCLCLCPFWNVQTRGWFHNICLEIYYIIGQTNDIILSFLKLVRRK
jgi:hypothetical protein